MNLEDVKGIGHDVYFKTLSQPFTWIYEDNYEKHHLDLEPPEYEAGVIFFQVRFQVLTATGVKMAVFWDVEPCSLANTDRRFRGPSCLLHQGSLPRVTRPGPDDRGSKLL
jgi:hypothetical protein